MDLLKEILIQVLSSNTVMVSCPTLEINVERIVESVCYQTLQKIKKILEDDTLEDPECFLKIEEIICAFEQIGSGAGVRHDFG